MFKVKSLDFTLNNVIKLEQSNLGRKATYDIEHYLDIIYKVLYEKGKWSDLDEILNHNTYYKKFRRWVDQEVFQKAFEILIAVLNKNIFSHKHLEKMFMDSTDIQNKSGFEDTFN